MSYDVYMEIDTGLRMATVEEVGNYTSNVGSMWRKAIEGGLRSLDSLTGEEALPILQAGIEYMNAHWAEMIAMNPKSGWGDAEGALRYLEKIRNACREHPKARVRIRA